MTAPRVRRRHREGVGIVYEGQCPLCQTWADVDDDQIAGRVSMQCEQPDCTYHETHDLGAQVGELARLAGVLAVHGIGPGEVAR